MIDQKLISESWVYTDYIFLLEKLLSEGKTTGLNQSEEFLNYAKINLQRMRRIEKTSVISEELKNSLLGLKASYVLLVITEGWCGDAAQNIPILHLLEKMNSKLQLRLLLRDEHLDLMDHYLTHGSRSIPKVICIEKESLKEVFVWGPRPKPLQNLVIDLLAKGVSKEEKGLLTQNWYNADKTKSLQKELNSLFQSI